MRNFWKLICMAVVLLTFTQCGKDSEPEPEPEPEAVTETWQLTYNDYHHFMHANDDEYQMTHKVTVIRNGNELTFIGLFPEYPESSIKATTNGYTVSIPDAQIIEINGNDTIYFHCGYVYFSYYWSYTNGQSTDIDFKPETGNYVAFRIQNDGRKMIATANQYNDSKRAFWISPKKDGNISFYSRTEKDNNGNYLPTTGTGFPDIPNMHEMELTKISDSDK